jgi:hypothetical protein
LGRLRTGLNRAKAIGDNLALVSIEGCASGVPPKGDYPVAGSAVAITEGATVSTTLAGVEAEGKLKFGGNKAGLDGKITSRSIGGTPVVLT